MTSPFALTFPEDHPLSLSLTHSSFTLPLPLTFLFLPPLSHFLPQPLFCVPGTSKSPSAILNVVVTFWGTLANIESRGMRMSVGFSCLPPAVVPPSASSGRYSDAVFNETYLLGVRGWISVNATVIREEISVARNGVNS